MELVRRYINYLQSVNKFKKVNIDVHDKYTLLALYCLPLTYLRKYDIRFHNPVFRLRELSSEQEINVRGITINEAVIRNRAEHIIKFAESVTCEFNEKKIYNKNEEEIIGILQMK